MSVIRQFTRPAALLILVLFGLPAVAAYHEDDPTKVLEDYIAILEKRDFSGIAGMMEAQDMADLKVLMDGAIKAQARSGNYGLMTRVFGKRVPLKEVEATSADVYIETLAQQILTAADQQHFVVRSVNILGHVDETPDLVHFVARLNLEHDGEQTTDIYTYTLVMEDGGWKLKFPPTIRQLLVVIDAATKGGMGNPQRR